MPLEFWNLNSNFVTPDGGFVFGEEQQQAHWHSSIWKKKQRRGKDVKNLRINFVALCTVLSIAFIWVREEKKWKKDRRQSKMLHKEMRLCHYGTGVQKLETQDLHRPLFSFNELRDTFLKWSVWSLIYRIYKTCPRSAWHVQCRRKSSIYPN